MRSIAIALLVFCSLPVALVSPHVGMLIFSWISYMNPHRLTWGFAYNFQFAFVAGAITALAVLLTKEPKRIPLTPVTVLLGLFTLWISITTIFMNYPREGIYEWQTLIKILLFNGFLTLMVMGTRERLHALIWMFVICLGYFGVKGGLFTILGGGENRVWGPAGSFIADNNQLALAQVMTLPLMRYLQLNSRSPWVRWALLGAMLLTLVAIIGSYSRGALLAISAMLFFLTMKSRQRLLISIALFGALVLTVMFMPDKWAERMMTIGSYEQDTSAMGRIDAWLYTLDVATQNPIFGGGFGYQAGHTRVAHSIYFDTLGQHGFIGLTIFLLLGVAVLRTGSWIVRHTRNQPNLAWARDLGSMIQVSMIGYAVGGAFLNLGKFDLYYHLIAVMVLTRAVVEKELAASRPVPRFSPEYIAQPDAYSGKA